MNKLLIVLLGLVLSSLLSSGAFAAGEVQIRYEIAQDGRRLDEIVAKNGRERRHPIFLVPPSRYTGKIRQLAVLPNAGWPRVAFVVGPLGQGRSGYLLFYDRRTRRCQFGNVQPDRSQVLPASWERPGWGRSIRNPYWVRDSRGYQLKATVVDGDGASLTTTVVPSPSKSYRYLAFLTDFPRDFQRLMATLERIQMAPLTTRRRLAWSFMAPYEYEPYRRQVVDYLCAYRLTPKVRFDYEEDRRGSRIVIHVGMYPESFEYFPQTGKFSPHVCEN